jgi:hypothetical protein
MSTEFWVQMVIYAISIGSFAGVVLTKLAYLEKKMDKHNGLVEKVAVLERADNDKERRLANLERAKQAGS